MVLLAARLQHLWEVFCLFVLSKGFLEILYDGELSLVGNL